MKRKDMYLPAWVCGLGVFFLAGALLCLYFGLTDSVYALFLIAPCLGLGAAAILCWKNQWVEMINDSTFVYSTMFGRKTEYHVSEIVGLRWNRDSRTLCLVSGKVHIESCAILSDRFRDIICDVPMIDM